MYSVNKHADDVDLNEQRYKELAEHQAQVAELIHALRDDLAQTYAQLRKLAEDFDSYRAAVHGSFVDLLRGPEEAKKSVG